MPAEYFISGTTNRGETLQENSLTRIEFRYLHGFAVTVDVQMRRHPLARPIGHHRMAYVVAVPCDQRIPTENGSSRADHLAAHAPIHAWKRRSCGDGAKGPRLYDWAVASLPDAGTADHGFTRWLLIRRSITNAEELAYYLCYGPEATADEHLIRVAGTRWAVEMNHP